MRPLPAGASSPMKKEPVPVVLGLTRPQTTYPSALGTAKVYWTEPPCCKGSRLFVVPCGTQTYCTAGVVVVSVPTAIGAASVPASASNGTCTNTVMVTVAV